MRAGGFFISAIFALSACKKSEELAVHSCFDEYMCTADGAIIRWQDDSINFSFERSTPPNLALAMEKSAEDYNAYLEDTQLQIDSTNIGAQPYNNDPSSLNKDGTNGIYYVKGTWPWETRIPGSLAVTLTRYGAYGIIEADIFVKADSAKYQSAGSNQFLPWVKYIASHELGHALGRSHSKEKTSLMYPSISLAKVANIATEADFRDFFSIYDINIFNLAYEFVDSQGNVSVAAP